MGRTKPKPPDELKAVVDLSKSMEATAVNFDERLSRVSPDTALLSDYALGLVNDILDVCAPWRIKGDVYDVTWRAFQALERIRFGCDVLTRQKVSSR
jgi:hypothetical protein